MVFTFTNPCVIMYVVKFGTSVKNAHKSFCYGAQNRGFYRFQFCIFNQPLHKNGIVGSKYMTGTETFQGYLNRFFTVSFPCPSHKIHSTEVTTKWLRKFSL